MMRCRMSALLAAIVLIAGAAPVYAARIVVGIAPTVRVVAPVPARPAAGYYVWTPGYWNWTGARYVWVPGVYVMAPRPGVSWIPGRWVAGRRGWVWVGGHWR